MPQYEVHFQEGYGFRSDPDSWKFRSPDDTAAFSRIASAMDTAMVRGRPKLKDFYAADGKKVCRGDGTTIFPKPRKVRKDRKSRNVIRGRRKIH